MVKEQFREKDVGRAIGQVSFRPGSAWELGQVGVVEVVRKELYAAGGSREPAAWGPLDKRLGLSTSGGLCETCHLDLNNCVGHFGFLTLDLPVFHVGYFKQLIHLLQCICKNCSGTLLPANMQAEYQRKVNAPNRSYLDRKTLFKKIHVICKKSKACAGCGFKNGVVKKVVGAVLKIVHVTPPGPMENYRHAMKDNKEIESFISKTKVTLLNPLVVLNLINNIPEEEIGLATGRADVGHPRNLIMTRIPVPPACIRPSVVSDIKAGTNEDDITMKIAEIILLNDCIRKHKKEGGRMQQITEDWDFLQIQCALFINSEISGLPLSMQQKKFCRSFAQRLKGKQGRFRGNLSGKRVDFSGRTVISPDPHLRIDQVGVPVLVAKTMTYPEKVTRANIAKLRVLVRNGTDSHPGANFIVHKDDDQKKFLKYGNREAAAKELKLGDTVERHMLDGDVVLFNRQPSLHKISIMAHRAKVLPWRTFRFNECACTPYNADFDGDEMNLHLPQTEEAKAEAWELMGVSRNLVTPRSGEPLVAAIQDFITGGYVLTLKDRFFTRPQMCQMISSILSGSDTTLRIDLPPPAIMRPRCLWTGKQLFSLILKPNAKCKLNLNLTTKGKSYTGQNDLCPNDGFVVIRNSQIMCGVMDKSTLGSGSKLNVFYIMMRDYGEEAAITAMWRLGRLAPIFLSNHGFSIGIGDVKPGPSLLAEKAKLLSDGYATCQKYIEQLKDGRLKADPGSNEEQTLESLILKELSTIRDRAGKACLQNLSPHNAPLIMAVCGSKGSFINISQMVACVGQQAISGKRPPDGFERRSLPHFAPSEKTPEAKGFVENSFYSGLTPTEFVFHTMAGREGLVDTAVKTAETGYMQRRLVKCLEDLCAHYDGTVRSAVKEVVQFTYGEDNLDPALMEAKDGSMVDYGHLLEHVRATNPSRSVDDHLDPEDTRTLVESTIRDSLSNVQESYRQQFQSFIMERVEAGGWAFRLGERCSAHESRRAAAKSCAECAAAGKKRTSLIRSQTLSSQQVVEWLELCGRRWQGAQTEPGTAVGAVAATSIGEPSTQMTLKTFHFAGVASMNITQGVPRIKEIINAVKNISTPIINAPLVDERNEELARRVKGRIEKTTLGEVTEYIEDVYLQSDSFIVLKLAKDRIRLLQLSIDMMSVTTAIAKAKLGVPVKMGQMEALGPSVLLIRTVDSGKTTAFHAMQHLRKALQGVVVAGLPSVVRSVIHADDRSGESFKILVEGTDFQAVLATEGVDGKRATFNNALEVARVLGVEAARKVIIDEILLTMANHGIALDRRHVMLLAELMTYKGMVHGMTRQGLSKMKESVLMLASFERTIDHLFEAAFFAQEDEVCGVSECIIMGIPMSVGTGLFSLLQKLQPPPVPLATATPLLHTFPSLEGK